jgi:hypothetical protein
MKKIFLFIAACFLVLPLFAVDVFPDIDFTLDEITLKISLARRLAEYDIKNELIAVKFNYAYSRDCGNEEFEVILSTLYDEEKIIQRMMDSSVPILLARGFDSNYITEMILIACSIEIYYLNGFGKAKIMSK